MPSLPTPDYVCSYLHKWERDETYQYKEHSLGLLFKELCPANNLLAHVLLKVSVLNDLYSTNIYDTYTVAKHIWKMNMEHRLKSGDGSLVNELAMVTIKGKTRNFYSFASKYCSYHFPDSYPIYDSYVKKMLFHYARVDSFSHFTMKDLKHYESFVKVILDFQNYYRLGQFSLRQIDIFLWLAGKESFPLSHNKFITRPPMATAPASDP